MKTKEMRTHGIEVRAAPATEGGGLRFSGYAAKFDTWSQDLGGFRERIQRGAFREAVARDDVRALVNHDPGKVLGRTKSGTLRLREDETGLHFEVDAPDASWARDLRLSVERGDVNQCSFAFSVKEGGDEWRWADPNAEGALDERTIKAAKLFDVSIVTFPAYEDTEANARGASEARAAASAEREKALREAAAQKRRRLRKRLELSEKSF